MDMIELIMYATRTKKEPFSDWKRKLEKGTQAIINNRLNKIRLGNFGDTKAITNSGGVFELRIHCGPGYRIYFGKQKNTIIVLLIGGDKGNQNRDIEKAKRYWLDYKEQL